jgi:predicted HTH transcriptional regulator
MTTIFVIVAFVSGLLAGSISVWRWGEASRRALPGGFDAEALQEVSHTAVMNRIALRKERIMEAANALGKITNDGVEDLFCISDRTASAYLRQLTRDGKLERVGSGRGTFYVPVMQKETGGG